MNILKKYILPSLGISLLLAMYFIPLYFFEDMPDKIPKHFNKHGAVNVWTPKGFIYLIPMIATALYLFIELLGKFIPYALKKMDYIEEEINNFLSLAVLMLRTFNLLFMVVFFYVTLTTVMISLGKWEGLSPNLTSAIFTGFFALIVTFVFRFSKLKE